MDALTKDQNAMLVDLLMFGKTVYGMEALPVARELERRGYATVEWAGDIVGPMQIAVAPTEMPDMETDPDSEASDWRLWKP